MAKAPPVVDASRRRLARAVFGVGLGLALATVCGVLARRSPHAPLAERIARSRAVTAADGTLLRLTLAPDGQYRLWTPLERISPLLEQATLLYEDRRFYLHPGVNPFALGRAALSTYLTRTSSRRIGGSTLTMQLARRLWNIDSRTWWGKCVQIARALELELRYSKHDILEAYLNLAPYGGNIEGAGAAAEIYFRKPAANLTLAEALTLAVIPQSPTRRAHAEATPDSDDTVASRSPASAPPGPGGEPLERARRALRLAWDRAHPPLAATSSAKASPEPPVRSWPRLRRPDDLPFIAPHFVDMVLAAADAPVRGDRPRTVDADTLSTTLDVRLQRLVERHLQGYVKRRRAHGIRNAAALLVDGRTMAIRALCGSADFFDSTIAGQVNGVTARRSPGSTLKPLVYALGMDQGLIHPATMLRDVPTSYAAYSPENFDGRFAGPLPAREALIRSRNVPALEIAARLARPSLYGLLTSAGVELPRPEGYYGLGLALGTAEVTMEDLVRLYAALASGGVVRDVVWSPSPSTDTRPGASSAAPGVALVSPESAFLVMDILRDNPRPSGRTPGGNPSSARAVPVAWKTGTSWGFRDAWSIGVFGPYILAVWVGDFSGAGNPAFVGAEAAAPLFFELVDSLVAQRPAEIAHSIMTAPPRGLRRLEVCALSGGLPTSSCPHRRSTWFIPGRSPIEPCAIHRTYVLDARGRRTCAAGAPATRSETFEVWPSDLARLFAMAGLPRQSIPPAAPGCAGGDEAAGAAPRITSPLAGVTYTLRLGTTALADTGAGEPGAASDSLALQAVTDGDADALFWFADESFLGRVHRGTTLFWNPPAPGHYTMRVIDDRGRADVRMLAVERRPPAGPGP